MEAGSRRNKCSADDNNTIRSRTRIDVVMDADAVRKIRINMECGEDVLMIIVLYLILWKTRGYIDFF